jgi:stage III sporulation protein AE
MTVREEIVGKSIVPFCGICLSLALIGACEGGPRLAGLLSGLKKKYTLMLSFFMMLLLAMLSSQTVLGASQDTLAMRSAKFAAGNMIPVVGGSVGETLKTVSGSVAFLKNTVGIGAHRVFLFQKCGNAFSRINKQLK